MDREVLIQLAKGAIPPALFALALFGTIWAKARVSQSTDSTTSRDWRHTFGPLFAMLVIFASWPIAFSFSFPPAEVFDRIPWIWLGLAALGAAMHPVIVRLRAQSFQKMLLAALLMHLPALAALVLVYPALPNITKNGLLAGTIALSMASLLAGLTSQWPRLVAVLQFITLAATSQVLILAFSSLKLGQAVGMLAAISGVVMALTLWKKRDVAGEYLHAFLANASVLALLAGVQTNDAKTPWVYVFLLTLAPLTAFIVNWIPFRSEKVRRASWVTVYVAAIIAAVVIAVMNQPTMEY